MKCIYENLKRADEQLEVLINRFGILEISPDKDVFNSIIYHIVGQMLSKKAAETIYLRLVSLVGEITPYNIVQFSIEQLRDIGLSYKKSDYVLNISRMVSNKELDLSILDKLDDTELIRTLTCIKGIGKWTAEMLALFTFGRLDIWCYDDVALRNGITKAHPELSPLTKKSFDELGQKYKPYRSIASLYYYKNNDEK